MARPESNTVAWFPHPVSHGPGMYFMRQKWGNDGYVAWFTILENLGRSEFHFLDLQSNVRVMYLSAHCGVDKDALKGIIEDLVELGEFDREFWEEETILFNEKFINSIATAYKKRKNTILDRSGLLRHLLDIGRLKPDKWTQKPNKRIKGGGDNTQSRVDKSIKEKKKDINIEKSDESKSRCPYQKIVALYHEHCVKMPKADLITELKVRLRARWKEPGRKDLEWWDRYFERSSYAPWLNGENDRGWQANLWWLTGPKNMAKVLAGQYDPPKEKKGMDPRRAEIIMPMLWDMWTGGDDRLDSELIKEQVTLAEVQAWKKQHSTKR